MALANFFDKTALSAASILRGAGVDAIRDRLMGHIVGVAFDESAATSREARHSLELLVDLSARLYPRLAIITLPVGAGATYLDAASSSALVARLQRSARAINPRIEITSSLDSATVLVVVGKTVPRHRACRDPVQEPTIYVGSSGWHARLSAEVPLGSGPSENPFGAGVAACLAAASVFRHVFAVELGHANSAEGSPAGWTNLSLIDLTVSAHPAASLATDPASPKHDEATGSVDIGETFLIGAGAIGEAAVWALGRMPWLEGTLHVVDGETVELSNLQRYVLTTQESVGTSKVKIALGAFAESNEPERPASTRLNVIAHPTTWGPYVAARDDYVLDRVLLALDSAEDRIAAQASLPRWIANAWTQPENVGLSRHDFMGDGPCVCCLYLPHGPRKSKDVLYAEALQCATQGELMEVRTLLHNGRAIGSDFILRAATRLGVPPDDLMPFAHQSLEEFYVSALCAGLVLRLGGQLGSGRPAEVPAVFQSALAGILLAAELVIDAAGLRSRKMPARTEIDLVRMNFLSPDGIRLGSPMSKDPSGRCICQDPVFRDRYRAKYAVRAVGPNSVG